MRRITHTTCPKCAEDGRDRHGDNLAVYSDGGSYCFSCGYYTQSQRYAPVGEKKERFDPTVSPMPTDMLLYLENFLTLHQIDEHFIWDDTRQRAVLKKGLPYFYWGRQVVGRWKDEGPKVLTFGEKPFEVFAGQHVRDNRVLVCVEDPISAIKVGERYATFPLFGSQLPPDWLRKISVFNPRYLVFWLDHDKLKESMAYTMTMRNLYHARCVDSLSDPKAYDLPAIVNKINQVLT